MRVLVENPDRAELQGAVGILADSGYEVAVCVGADGGGLRCPLVEFGYCNLAGGADIVVTSAALPEARELLEAHDSRGWPPVVVEATPQEKLEFEPAIPDAIFIRSPMSAEDLRAAVASARAEAM